MRDDEWLPHARRLAVGQRSRVRHGNERRLNLVVGHVPDKFWAYCQACKMGAVKLKEHVLLGEAPPPVLDMRPPQDLVPMLQSPYANQLLGFLARKGMDVKYFRATELYFSESSKRLCIHTGSTGLLGRDITDKSVAKWLAYSKPSYIGRTDRPLVVIVEDALSMYKVQYALDRQCMEASVVCSLGTEPSSRLLLAIAQAKPQNTWMFYDGDAAGYTGADNAAARLRGFGCPVQVQCATEGKDPKDMTLAEISTLGQGVLLRR